jgi:hypothetical protein
MSEEILTQDYLKQVLDYNSETGLFFWKKIKVKNQVKIGSIAGWDDGRGYLKIEINRKSYRAHRLAWFYVYGVWPKEQIDHINGIKSDNRIINLRDITNAQNQQNKINPSQRNKSGLLGVYKNTNCSTYCAEIRIDGNKHVVRGFKTALEAHKKYLELKKQLHEYSTL